ncbi:MAG: transcription initiation factor [Thermoproteota archaeon]|nr:transcription initiation factor [Thermoproteota archaeon]
MTINETVLDKKCPNCGSESFVEDSDAGEVICRRCGLVSEKIINKGPEWRSFGEGGEERSRVGMPLSLSMHDKGLSTVIDMSNRDAFGRQLPTLTRQGMFRLRKWQNRITYHSSSSKNLTKAMLELDRLADELSIASPVKEQAAQIYRKALNRQLIRGRSILAIVAAALYAACRFTQTPKTLKQISKASISDKKDVARSYRLLLNELDIQMPIVDAATCVSKIASKIGLEERVQQRAKDLLNRAEKKKFTTGKEPMGMAATALYIATILDCDSKKRTQKEIAKAADITEVTLRNRYKCLKRQLKLDI